VARVSPEQQQQILQAGREIAFDRVWIVSDSSLGHFDVPVNLYLVVRVGAGRAVSARTVPCFRDAVERIVPGARVGVDAIENLQGMDDPQALQVLLTMVELKDRLTDRDAGVWLVQTESTSVYILDLNPGSRTLTRLRGTPHLSLDNAPTTVAELRRDGQTLKLLSIEQLQLCLRGYLWVDVREDGIATLRETTPVVSIESFDQA
jgi:hypothetical protein